LRIVVHSEVPNDPALRRDWNDLVHAMERPQVFYTYEWAIAVQQAYRQEMPVLLLLGYDGDALKGVAALALDRNRKSAHLLCHTTADYCDFVSRGPDRENFVAGVLKELLRSRIQTFQLANLPADSLSLPALRAAAQQLGIHIFDRLGYQCAQINLGTGEGRAQLRHALDKKKMFRRNINFLRRNAPVRLERIRSALGAREALPEFYEAHVARFFATQRISNLVRSERRHFLAELAERLAEADSFVLTRLMVGDQAVAWNYGFQFERSLFWYQPTFDSRVEEHSPGYCLLSQMIIEACDEPALDVVDLGLGAEGYKERFANASRETRHLTLTTSRRRYRAVATRFRLAETIKASPRAERLARGIVSRGLAVRKRMRTGSPRDFILWSTKRLSGLVSSREQVEFYEWDEQEALGRLPMSDDLVLRTLDLQTLARAAMRNEEDSETLTYLLRAARRLRSQERETRGFVLVDRDRTPVHFGWTAPFQGFVMDELSVRLTAPSEGAIMIFDCWTPQAFRGHGYYGFATSLLARRILAQGTQPWIFSARTNESSVRGIVKVGFLHRYSMVARKTMGWRTVERVGSIQGQKQNSFVTL